MGEAGRRSLHHRMTMVAGWLRFGAEAVTADLWAQGRRIVVVDPDETTDDLVRDMIEVLTACCARLYGRCGARNRALAALKSAKAGP